MRHAPLTLRTCKQHPGFLGETGDKGPAHGVEDTLLATAAFALDGDAGPLDRLRTCDTCSHVLRSLRGLLRETEGGYRRQKAPDRRTQAHVGLDRRRQGAASGILYAREVMSETRRVPAAAAPHGDGAAETTRHAPTRHAPTTLTATVQGDKKTLKALAEHLGEGAVLHVGTAISRGLGRCRVVTFGPAPAPTPLAERIERFQAAWAGATSQDGPAVALTLLTPALFTDDFLRPTTTPDGLDLLASARADEEDAAREALSRLTHAHQVGRAFRLAAWNGLAGFPHRTDQGLQAGSVLVYRAPEIGDALLDALAHVEDAGVGLRRALGFGQVRVCDPVHVDVREHSTAP